MDNPFPIRDPGHCIDIVSPECIMPVKVRGGSTHGRPHILAISRHADSRQQVALIQKFCSNLSHSLGITLLPCALFDSSLFCVVTRVAPEKVRIPRRHANIAQFAQAWGRICSTAPSRPTRTLAGARLRVPCGMLHKARPSCGALNGGGHL